MNKIFILILLTTNALTGCGAGGDRLRKERTADVTKTMTTAINEVPSYFDTLLNTQYDFASALIASDKNCPPEVPVILPLPNLTTQKQKGLCPSAGIRNKLKEDFVGKNKNEIDEILFRSNYYRADIIVAKYEDFEPYLEIVKATGKYIEILAKSAVISNDLTSFQLEDLKQIAETAKKSKETIEKFEKEKKASDADLNAFKELYDFFQKLYKNQKDVEKLKDIIEKQGPGVEQQLEKIAKNINDWDKSYLEPLISNTDLVQRINYDNIKNDLDYNARRAFVKARLIVQTQKSEVKGIGSKTAELLRKEIEAHKHLSRLVLNDEMTEQDRDKAMEYGLSILGDGIVKSAKALAELIALAIKAMAIL
ncbi:MULTISPECIES: hypothetical protein [Methylomonas]|uniref:Uncharacterized protein n=2 Tax=Methylomonas TaxID=416 RepID=A0A140E5G3_9GAMM|nr:MULTISPECIES: hypothetical protein [Methylomonas]AMK75637.1 hypothetical protein JT25_003900 [Methylomonas denitrificans]OAH96154.1 hypothetical protein A1342_06720 [Methylomonas methanica]TCV75247.1 hypothetical protein EDE11_1358 [Methylomonas methanica]